MKRLDINSMRRTRARPSAARAPLSLIIFMLASFNVHSMSLEFQQMKLSEAFNVYADFTGKNIVVDTEIDQIIDVRLNNITPDQLLETLTEMYDLVPIDKGDIILILTRQQYEQRYTSKQFRTIKLKNNNAQQISQSLQSARQQDETEQFRNAISYEARTNTIILEGSYAFVEAYSKIIQDLDKPQQQIQLLARLVAGDISATKNLGVRLKAAGGYREDDTMRWSNRIDQTS